MLRAHHQHVHPDHVPRRVLGDVPGVARGRVIESGMLINNTRQPDQTPQSSGGALTQSARASPEDDAFKEGKIMCAPITTIDAFHKEGIVVCLRMLCACLEVWCRTRAVCVLCAWLWIPAFAPAWLLTN